MRRRLPSSVFLWVAVFLSACGTDSCSCEGFEARDFPTSAIDKTVPSVGQARVTRAGLTYIESQIPYLVDQALPNGLNFCIPRDTSGNPDICVDSTCPGGAPGCPVDLTLADQGITTRAPETIEIDVTIGDVDERLNFDYSTFIGTVNCYVQVFKKGASESTPAVVFGKAPVRIFVDQASPFKEVGVDIGEVTVDLEDVDFKIHGRGNVGDTIACEGASLVRGFFRDTIENEIRNALRNAVEGVRRDQLCSPCDAGMCPTGSSCASDDICDYSAGNCVPRTLGMEGRLDVSAVAGDFLRESPVRVDVVAKGADIANVDTGINVGLRAGFVPVGLSECVPADEPSRPTIPNLSMSPTVSGNTKPGGGNFQFGVGLHKSAIEQALWSIWGAGGTCLEVSDRDVMVLSTTAFSLVAPSMKDLARGGKSAVLSVVANEAPTVELGANTVMPSGDTYTVTDPLLRILWNDVDFHVFVYAQDRMVRLFTLRLDLDLPVAIVPDGSGNLIPIIPDLEDAIASIEPRRLELLSESADKIRDVVPTLLGIAAPQLAGALPGAIGLPEFLGFELQLDQGDITAVDNDEYIAIFANLARSGSPLGFQADTVIFGHEIDYGQVLESGIVRPVVRIDVGSWNPGEPGVDDRDYEFSWRVDGGFWSMFRNSTTLEIADPLFAIQGEHEIEVRARVVGEVATADATPAKTKVVIDWEDPEVRARHGGEWVMFDGFDLADDDLEYRLVDKNGNATAWTRDDKVSLVTTPIGGNVVVEARDDSGRVAQQPMKLPEPQKAGCSTTGGEPAEGVMLVLLVAMFGFGRTRRRKVALAVAAAATLMTACNGGCKGELTTNTGQSCFGEGCNVDQDCTVDSDCNGICPNGNGGICEADRCMCVQACDPGCDEEAFCCLSTQACVEFGDPCGGDLGCEPGYEPGVQSATPNRESCELEDVVCECVPLPPIDIGWHGQYASVDSDGGLTVVATYNKKYEDLMLGRINADASIDWFFVDGVPTMGTPEGDPTGYRKGLIEKAEDVGTHTAVAIDGSGRAHVFYRDEDADVLKWGVATFDGENVKFDAVVVDPNGSPGIGTAAVITGTTLHVLYGASAANGDSELRHLQLTAGAAPTTGTAPAVVLTAPAVEQGKGYPAVVASFIHMSVGGTTPFAVFYNGIDTRVGRMQFSGGAWTEPTYVASGTGPHAGGALGADGLEHVAFMQRTGLRYSRFGETQTSQIDDGKRTFADEYWNGTTGEGIRLRLDGNIVTAAYQDAFDRTLITAKAADGSNWTVARRAIEGTGTGFWIALTYRGEPWVVDMVVDRATDEVARLRATRID